MIALRVGKEGRMTRGTQEGNFGNTEYVHSLDCADGFMCAYIKNFQTVHFKYMQFIAYVIP